MAFTDIEDGLALCECTRRTAGEALGGLSLADVKNGEHLVAATLDKAHLIPLAFPEISAAISRPPKP